MYLLILMRALYIVVRKFSSFLFAVTGWLRSVTRYARTIKLRPSHGLAAAAIHAALGYVWGLRPPAPIGAPPPTPAGGHPPTPDWRRSAATWGYIFKGCIFYRCFQYVRQMVRSYTRRGFRRYRRSRSRRYIRRRGVYRRRRNYRRPYRRSANRLVRRRFGSKNPFGDRVQIKFNIVHQGQLTFPISPSTNAQFVAVEFNNMADIIDKVATAPGMTQYANLFENYRISGVKVTLTPITASPLLIGFVYAGNQIPVVNTHSLTETRWSRWKALGNVNAGGATKRISRYFSVVSVGGGDRTIANDADWTGETNTASPFFTAPAETVNLYFGASPLTAFTEETVVPYIVSLVVYTTFWNRRSIV